jgi:hypothetical protein
MALLTSWRRKTTGIREKLSAPPKSVRLHLERLETRYCPSPTFSMFKAQATSTYPQVELSGSVSDTDPGTLVVTFSGSGVSASVTLASSGNFDIFTTASSLGNVTATAVNQSTNKSSAVSSPIIDQAPVISNFQASQSSGNYWTFTGQVSDDQSVTGLVVTLGGLPSLKGVTATVNSNGWFSITIKLQPGEDGTATAQTTDWWGKVSNTAWTIVHL